MTGADFSDVDIDLLADYVGGVLDGTPEAAEVAARIDADPQWRDAHDALLAGMAAVDTELRAMGAAPEPMPADVVARIDAALATAAGIALDDDALTDAASADTTVADAGDAEDAGAAEAGPRRHLVAVPSGGARVGAARRRWRWAAPIGVAAGVLAFAGLGVNHLVSPASKSTESADSTAMLAQPASGAAVLPDAGQIRTTSTDYAPDTLRAEAARALSAPAAAQDRAEPGAAKGAVPSVVPSAEAMTGVATPLQRLRARDALQACLDAIALEYGPRPLLAQSIEYARFAQAPSLIVRFAGPDGTWVWVSGPDCGVPGAGAATRFREKVG
ncbi:hypothetical protein EV385_2823 [Krasilnikovia cinnamomea]|uniref:Uncharacterized protein n=1 Tax=Krasilnikovia cinnamomea TaxID=349313 RepID=A0A4Q7ZL54_9ACTN|nr:hypothetical protein [Krasilnikovia cinnamomea]RZU51025.1 hypothetical protein EV385_2823 [Krasilnikovia cinnamomea]